MVFLDGPAPAKGQEQLFLVCVADEGRDISWVELPSEALATDPRRAQLNDTDYQRFVRYVEPALSALRGVPHPTTSADTKES